MAALYSIEASGCYWSINIAWAAFNKSGSATG